MNNSTNEFQATKIVHQVGSLTFYEVQEEELDIIKYWPKNKFPFLLELSIFLFWVFLSSLLTLLTWLKFEKNYLEITYYVILFTSFIISIITLVLYFFIKKEDVFSMTIQKIISRKK